MDNYSTNLIGLVKAADDMTAREALDKLTPYLENAADKVDSAASEAMENLPDAEAIKASLPGAVGSLAGYGAGGAGAGWLASLLSKKISGKRSLPAIIASVLGGGVLGGIGGRHAGEAIGDAVKSASMTKQALSPAQILSWARKFNPEHVASRLAKRNDAIDGVHIGRKLLNMLLGGAAKTQKLMASKYPGANPTVPLLRESARSARRTIDNTPVKDMSKFDVAFASNPGKVNMADLPIISDKLMGR